MHIGRSKPTILLGLLWNSSTKWVGFIFHRFDIQNHNRPLSQPTFIRKISVFSSEKAEKGGGDPIGSSTTFEDFAAEKTGVLAGGGLGKRSNGIITLVMKTKLSVNKHEILKEPYVWGPVSSIFSDDLAESHLIGNVHVVPFVGNNCVLLHTIESGWAMPGGTL
jgi:hypothetical protein